MEDISFREDLSSMLEVEVGFRGKFILEQHCQRKGIDLDNVSNETLPGLVDRMSQVMAGFMGVKRAAEVQKGLMEYAEAVNNINKGPAKGIQTANSFVILGDKWFYIKKMNESLMAYRKALEILGESNIRDLKLECRLKRKIARVLGQSKEHYADAKSEYESVISISERMSEHYETSLGYIGLGNIAWLEGSPNTALEFYRKAQTSMEKLGTRSKKECKSRKKLESLIHIALADLHLDLRDIERSLMHNETAISLLLDLENYHAVGKLYKKMRIIYQHKKECDRATKNCREVAFSEGSTGAQLMEGWTRMNLATLLMEDGKYSQAEEHLSKAYDLLSDFEYPEAHSKLHFIFGNIYYNKHELDASEAHFIKSLDVLGTNSLPEYYAQAQEGLGTLYICKGEREKGISLLKSALTWHEKNDDFMEVKRLKALINDRDEHCPVGIAML